jgi:catechol 2,3-dioxygenase-like lactoylglutathione lyase family enzyme
VKKKICTKPWDHPKGRGERIMGLLRVTHTSFTVSDVKAVAEWYCKVLGFEVVSEMRRPMHYIEVLTAIPGAELHVINVRGAGYTIELVQYTGAPGAKVDTATNNAGSAHIGFEVDDLHQMYVDLKAKGVRFVAPPMEILGRPGGYVTYLKDLEGNNLEFVQPPRDR